MQKIHGLMSKEKFIRLIISNSDRTVLDNQFSDDLLPIIYSYVHCYEDSIIYNYFKHKAIRFITKRIGLTYEDKIKKLNEIDKIWNEKELIDYMGWYCDCIDIPEDLDCCWLCDLNNKAWDHKSKLLGGPHYYFYEK